MTEPPVNFPLPDNRMVADPNRAPLPIRHTTLKEPPLNRPHLIRMVFVFSLSIALAGCSRSGSEGDRPEFPWQFVRIAELETDHPEALVGNLEYDSAAIGPDGTVFVATDAWKGVHEFDRNGKWIRNLGGEGHGPGEFQQIRYVSTSPTGQLALYDDIGRVSVFGADRVLSHTFRYMVNTASLTRIAFAGKAGFWTLNIVPGQNPTMTSLREDLIVLSSAGDTLLIHPVPDSQPEMSTGRVSSANPAVGALKWAVSPDGTVWLYTPNGEQLVHLSPAGGAPDSVAVQAYPAIFSDEQWTRIIEAQTAVMREVSFLNSYVEPTIEILEEIRDRWSPVQRMWWVDEHGLLVDRMSPNYPSIQRGPWRYSALRPDGVMTNEIEGPAGLLTTAYGYALTVTSEWLELPHLTLWRLEPVRILAEK